MQSSHPDKPSKTGFTLIELSIVLVIIGLIIGGILTGQDLINAAAIRAQISQIEHYNTAVRTFQNKYGYLPGDIPNPYATNFGFASRGSNPGEGDGNGVIEGILQAGVSCGQSEFSGETAMFWVDISQGGLIDGSFNTATTSTSPSANIGLTALPNYFPWAKIGGGNFVVVASGGVLGGDATNYFVVENFTEINALGGLLYPGNQTPSDDPAGLTVKQAYDIDKKVDDGLPQSGNVLAASVGMNQHTFFWAAGSNYSGNCVQSYEGNCTAGTHGPTTAATAGSSLTCYDNGGVAGTEQYSVGQSGGANINCALASKFQ